MLRSARLFSRVIIVISGICWVQVSAQTISWSKIAGPYSGSIQLLTVDSRGNVFVSTSLGIYRSTNAGVNWEALALSFEFGASFLVADSANSVYAGNGAGGLYESTDKGTSWAKSSLTGGAYCAAVLSGNGICIGGLQTVSISSDGGKSWAASQVTTDSRIEVLSVAQDNSGNIYAGLIAYHPKPPAPYYGGGVYISSDSGRTWNLHGMALSSILSIVVDAAGKAFSMTTDDKGNKYLYSAPPKSSTWTEDEAGIQYAGISIESLLSDNLGEAVAVTNIGIFVYSDSAASWKIVAPDISLASITSAFYNPKGTTYAGTDWNGVFFLGNSSSAWVQCGIYPRPVTSIGFDGSDNLFAGTDDAVFEQRPTDGAWLRVSDGLTHSTVYQLYYSALSKRLYASTAGGASYLLDRGNYWNSFTQQWTYDFVESSGGDEDITTAEGILKSAVGEGDLWTPLQPVGLPNTSIYCLALDSSNDLFAGTSLNGIFKSTDGGTFWTQTGISSPLIFYSVNTMEIDKEGRIFAGTDTSGAYYSDDLGVTWNSIPSISGKSITTFLVNHPPNYFAGTSDRGAFESTDLGSSWRPENNGLTDSSIMTLAIGQQGHLLAGTNEGLFTSTGIVARIDEKAKVPSSFSLFQNYPNPFNPATVISYQLSVNSLVTLKVYDVLGRLVKTLIEGRQTSGIHSVPFNASSLSSGIYFYRLAAGSYVETKKMILIK